MGKNSKEYNREYYLKEGNRIKAEKRVKYRIYTGQIELGPCCVCGSENSKPWFNGSDNHEHFEPYCDECRYAEEMLIDVEYERIMNLAEDSDWFRGFKKG